MRDVCERTPVDKRRVVLERLHQVRLQCVLEEDRHGPVRIEVFGQDRLLFAGIADHDFPESALQILEGGRKAEYRHDLGSDNDIEAVLTRKTIPGPTQSDRNIPQRPVVHAVKDMVVDQRGEKIVRKLYRVEVAREVEIDVLHRHHLREAAASGPALHAEHRPERGFTQADSRLLPDEVERIA